MAIEIVDLPMEIVDLPIEIVDSPIENGDFHSNVSLPEATS